MTTLAEERMRALLVMTRNQIVTRRACGLLGDDEFHYYRVQWCRQHGQKAWDRGLKGTQNAQGTWIRNDH